MLTNQKGEGTVLFTIMLVVLAFLVAVTLKHNFHHSKLTYSSVLVQKLKPVCTDSECKTKHGTYVIPTVTNDWWYFDFDFEPSIGGNSYAQYGNTLPPGGSWSKGQTPPRQEDVEEEEGVAVPEEDGNPLTPEEASAEESSTEPVDTSTESTSTESTSSDTSTGSDSGSSGDGGGGGDGGGD